MINLNEKERRVGTVSRGIRCPIIREGDNLAAIVADSVIEAAEFEGFSLRDRDVISITESIVARAQGNYASVNDIAADVKAKLGGGTVGVIFPILSRNRFAICLRGIARGSKKVVLMLSYPSDEVGNHLISLDQLDEKKVNPWSDVLTEAKYRELFGYQKHHFTGVDYVAYYRELIENERKRQEQILAEQRRREFTANVSHELKTPLTSMKVLADSLIMQQEVPNELYQEFMTDIAQEIDRENKIINDLLTPTSGEILVNGNEVGVESKKIISYLPERTYLDKSLKVSEVFKYFTEFYEDFNIEKARMLLKDLNLIESDRLTKMSKGMLEKLQLILVMSRDADLYILDEPLGGVDPATRDYILDTILSNFNENASVIISTHLISDIEKILDEVIFIDKGQIVLQSDADKLRNKENASIDEIFRRMFKC